MAGYAAGCPPDQILNFFRPKVYLQPKQLEMSAAARRADFICPECKALVERGKPPLKKCKDCGPIHIGVGGARGGGKSHWIFSQICADDCQRFPGLKVLYLRKSATAAWEQIRPLLRSVCGEGIETRIPHTTREQKGIIDFPNGSYIIVRHFKDEKDIENFIGQEYDIIAIEELTTLSHTKWEDLTSCLRSSKPGWRPRTYSAWNWGGVGHKWVKELFYDVFFSKDESETKYILKLVQDNTHNNPGYINQLQEYRGWKYQSWYLGDPNLAAGNFFTHYREDVHVYPCACPECKSEATFVEKRGIIGCAKCGIRFNGMTFQDEDAVRWWGSMDYGSSMPNCFHLFAENNEGECFTVAESHTVDLGISENSEEFKDLCRLHNLEASDLESVFGGEDILKSDRKSKDDGSTIATEFRENGIDITPIHINRVNAFSQMQERLGDPERGSKPTWFIHRSCVNLRSQIQTAQYDPKKSNDILKQNADRETGEGGSDALESGRNGIVGAYNCVLTEAKPIKVGAYQSFNEPVSEYVEVDAVIVKAEEDDRQRRAGHASMI